MRKYFFYGFGAILLILILWYFPLISYGIKQGWGQMNILWNVKSYEAFLEEGKYSEETKALYREKLELIREIKQYAMDSLGLANSDNYSRVYDQEGKSILWAITASDPYQLKPKVWKYGFLGEMPYRGYFDSTRAYRLVQELEEENYDVRIYRPSAWSTLGWFEDPVLSSMLHWPPGDLASLIIHELTHSTVWITGDVAYNENLADFIGDRGAQMFLNYKYGKNASQYQAYEYGKLDFEKFYEHILRGAESLDSLYNTFQAQDSDSLKEQRKVTQIKKIVHELDTIQFFDKELYQGLFKKRLPNNAYFMSYRRYRGKQSEFEKEFNELFPENLPAYIAYLKEKYE